MKTAKIQDKVSEALERAVGTVGAMGTEGEVEEFKKAMEDLIVATKEASSSLTSMALSLKALGLRADSVGNLDKSLEAARMVATVSPLLVPVTPGAGPPTSLTGDPPGIRQAPIRIKASPIVITLGKKETQSTSTPPRSQEAPPQVSRAPRFTGTEGVPTDRGTEGRSDPSTSAQEAQDGAEIRPDITTISTDSKWKEHSMCPNGDFAPQRCDRAFFVSMVKLSKVENARVRESAGKILTDLRVAIIQEKAATSPIVFWKPTSKLCTEMNPCFDKRYSKCIPGAYISSLRTSVCTNADL
jgi:hypothetical protein